MGFVEMLAAMAANSEPNRQEGDYEKDGLLHCGKCHTPKQTLITLQGQTLKPYCMCQCETEQYQHDEKIRKLTAIKQQIDRNRDVAFPDKDLVRCTFAIDDKSNPKISSVAEKYVANFKTFRADGKGLLFYGPTGTGKTFIAACIANAVLEKGYKVLMTSFPRLINTLSGMYEGKQEFIDDLNRYALLIIDDLATERDTEYTAEIVQNVIDGRYRAGKPLIITTNVSYQDFMNPPDIRKERLYSRLKEMCLPIEVKGKDRREQKLAENYADMSKLLGL